MSATVFNSPSTLSSMSYDDLRRFVLRSLSQVKDINAVNLYHRWNRLCRQAQADKLGHWYLRECLAEQVLPKNLQYLSSQNSTNHPFPAHWRAVMIDCIADLRRSKEVKFRQAHATWLSLLQATPPFLTPYVKTLATRSMNHYKMTRSAIHKSKLERLISQSVWNTAALPDCVKNLSSYTLTHDERSLLGLGLSFALPRSQKHIQT